jgi:hypothetical protein
MICPGRQGEMHGRLPESILHSDRLIAGSVRNPWDWYVSVWAYGCDGEGVLYNRLTGSRKVLGYGYRQSFLTGLSNCLHELCRLRRPWRETYTDSSSPVLFRRWLTALLDPERSRGLGENYSRSQLSGFAGFYTYRYCYLFHRPLDHLYDGTIHNRETNREKIIKLNRTNPSSRNKEFSFYYNRETSDLVERRDALIVEKYGYSPPEVKEL